MEYPALEITVRRSTSARPKCAMAATGSVGILS